MSWNGYGLSWWRCPCGAKRRVVDWRVYGDGRIEVEATPCKRCGSTAAPKCEGDLWL